MKKYFISLIICLFSFATMLSAQHNWKQMTTVEDVVEAYPEVMKNMLDHFNLDYPGLENVKRAYKNGNIEKACSELLVYYRNGNTAEYLRMEQPAKSDKTVAEADTILKDVFTIQKIKGKVPVLENGHRDWYYKGPNDDNEWAWLSNRHSQVKEVLQAYFETGNPKYANYIDLFLRDFIIASWPYPAEKSSTSVWRGLEVAARAKVWSWVFYGMINSEYLSPTTKLLMLSSLPDHAHYNRNFHAGNNWLTMEISALATVAANWPEYEKSDEWLDYAIETISESMKGQVYEDGVQTELTSHYHNVAMRNFVLFKDICDRAGARLPDFFDETIEKMYSYIAHVVRPDGHRILNNDGDRGSDVELILDGAKRYNHPEWKYIATNGTEGVKPKEGPSYFYPWAGHVISRSGFDTDEHWSFFDIGPWGNGHQHNDKLHISLAAFGRDLLVDAGRFAYRGAVAEKFRSYARGSQGHNILLVDGKGQSPGPRLSEEPLSEKHCTITENYDHAWGKFDDFVDLEGECEHMRQLFYVRGDMWVVIDKISTDRPRKVDALWHFHPDCEVVQKDKIVRTNNDRGNLQIIPIGNQTWNIKLIKGQEEPEIQGWYSEEYNKYEPNTATIYSTNVEGDSEFIWVLFPSENVENDIQAEILSKNDNELKLKVYNSDNDEWIIDIPL